MVFSVPQRQARRQQDDYDPLCYLPCSTVVQHSRSEVIYGSDHTCSHLFVVIAGCVQVSRLTSEGSQIIVDLYRTNDFFGENALVSTGRRGEEAVALEKTLLMSWKIEEVEQLMDRRPTLALALVRLMAEREIDLAERLENLSLDFLPLRLAKALIRFSQRLGTPVADGSVTMRAFTQEFLAQYLGTSREMVNASLSELRRQDFVHYSRRETTIRIDALQEWIRMNR